MLFKLIYFLNPIFIVLAFTLVANGNQITNVKNTKVLLTLPQSKDVKIGSKLTVINSDGKKVGLIEVLQIKNSKAVAVIKKGTAKIGDTSVLNSKISKKDNARTTSSWGIFTGYHTSNFSAKINSSLTAKMSGMSPSFKVFFEQNIDNNISAMTSFGYDSIDVEGKINSASCQSSTSCYTKISYLGLDAIVKYTFTKGQFAPWIGTGLGFLFPFEKKSSALNTTKISATQNIQITTGLNFNLNRNSFIPLQIFYNYFPSTTTSSANSQGIKIGYGLNY